ncbi:MAG: hypothetical protein KA368_04720 [Acidobacteria bacterium]|nr:hypothetical protein [Acidobacteriota bacterium]
MIRIKKYTVCCLAIAALVLFTGSLQRVSAQSQETVMTIQVPFDFQIGEQEFPAGKYDVKRNIQTSGFLLIQSTERKNSVFVSTTLDGLSEWTARGSMTFNKYGEKYFLSKVMLRGYKNGYALPKSKTERQQGHLAEAKIIRATPNTLTISN